MTAEPMRKIDDTTYVRGTALFFVGPLDAPIPEAGPDYDWAANGWTEIGYIDERAETFREILAASDESDARRLWLNQPIEITTESHGPYPPIYYDDPPRRYVR